MLPLAVMAVCLSAALSAPSLDPQLDDHWDLWKSWHTKKYHEVNLMFCFFIFFPLSVNCYSLPTLKGKNSDSLLLFLFRKRRAGGEWCGRRT